MTSAIALNGLVIYTPASDVAEERVRSLISSYADGVRV
jgi:hypothetical protein